jgi:hypothetical protein
MTDPKSMERLSARFETFRDKEPLPLFYSEWLSDLEQMSPAELPMAYQEFERRRPWFRFSPSQGIEALVIIGGDDLSLKKKVLQIGTVAGKELADDIHKHGLKVDLRAMECPWLLALVEAARLRYLGADGLVGDLVQRQMKGCDTLFNELSMTSGIFGSSMEDWVPRKFMQMADIVESSLRLIEKLSTKTAANNLAAPKAKAREQTDEGKASDLFERKERWCLDPRNTTRAMAKEAGIKHASGLTQTKTYKEKIKPNRDALKSTYQDWKEADRRIRTGMPTIDDSERAELLDKSIDALMDQDYELRTDRE